MKNGALLIRKLLCTLFLCLLAFTAFTGVSIADTGLTLEGKMKQAQTPPPAPGEIPDAYFKEAQTFLEQCQLRPSLSQYHNCDCLASEYLQERLKDNAASETSIMMIIGKRCIDATEAAGYEYERCLGNTPLLKREMLPEEYCTCFANNYARLFERYKAGVTSKVIVELQTQAHISCANPALAKRLFPFKPETQKK